MPEHITAKMIDDARQTLKGAVIYTPILPLVSSKIAPFLPPKAELYLKLEFFQHVGSFKARGAYLGVRGLDADAARRGVVTFSGGNHGLAVAWACSGAGAARSVPVKVVMAKATDPLRIDAVRALGAEVVLEADIQACFAAVERIRADEGRHFLHPFNDETMVLGAAVCGAEMLEQMPELDAMVVPIGGGGLIAGVASAVKLANPNIAVIGVEPIGGANMTRALEAGGTITMDRIDTIADSLGAPATLDYTFNIVRALVDEVITISDAELAAMMLRMRDNLGLMVEPACAAALGATLGDATLGGARFAGKRVGVLACGSNISPERWHENTKLAGRANKD